jgi:hypothetical protein
MAFARPTSLRLIHDLSAARHAMASLAARGDIGQKVGANARYGRCHRSKRRRPSTMQTLGKECGESLRTTSNWLSGSKERRGARSDKIRK